MARAIQLSIEKSAGTRGPFGAIVVKKVNVHRRGCDCVTQFERSDRHAEVIAIRQACRNIRMFELTGCEIYTSCEPCPMCLGAIYWARLPAFFWQYSRGRRHGSGV